MKLIDSKALPALPSDVKELVRNGVYSLYTLRSVADNAVYLLVASRGEWYFLSSEGAIVAGGEVRDLRSVVDQVVSFSDVTTDSVVINCSL